MDVVAPASFERREGLRWLGQLRWWALGGALGAVILALSFEWTFVDTAAVSAGVVVMGVVNVLLVWRARRGSDPGRNELLLHAAVDLLFLTWLLLWSGGLRNPISVSFSFHVVLGALLNGRRGAIAATTLSLVLIAALWSLDELKALPVPALSAPPPSLWLLSLGLLVVGLGYLALVLAERQAGVRARLVTEQREAARSVSLLLESLAALKVGLDLVDKDGSSQLMNETARALKEHPAAVEAAQALESAEPPIDAARVSGGESAERAVSRRFAISPGGKGEGGERIIDLVALPASSARTARALLYVDRTDELLVEQRQLMLERLATLGRAMQGVAHELNTPLTTMQTLAKDLRAALAGAPLDERLRSDVEESLTLLVEESRRCRALTQALLSRADDGRAAALPKREQSLLDIARRAVRLVAPVEEAEGGVLLEEKTLAVPCAGDPDRVLQIVMNLVQNALRATVDLRGDGKGPRVVVRAEPAPVGERPREQRDGRERSEGVRLVIVDRGPGLPDEVRARLFEPFVTTRPVGEGTGLGLYTSQRIAHELGGALSLEDAPAGGTVAALDLPA
jgi:signal transduction histidine kinase